MSSTVKSVTRQIENAYILSHADAPVPILPQWFSAEYWQSRGTVEPVGSGRGAAWFIHTQGHDYVLRHYRRGGLVAKLSQDRYLWHGLEDTRAWREWLLLAALQAEELPVPVPVAARVVRRGLIYTADILTARILDSVSLSTLLTYRQLDTEIWSAIGRCIRRFHDRHVCHADLNAHNILLNAADQVFLIDFDKSRIAPGRDWQSGNLQRLQRSLHKLQMQNKTFYFTASDWEALLQGYAHQ